MLYECSSCKEIWESYTNTYLLALVCHGVWRAIVFVLKRNTSKNIVNGMMSFHQPLSLFLFLLDGGPWEEGEQMLGEGGGGNVGVHADHHVLNLSSAPPFPQPLSPQHHGSSPCSLEYTTTTTHRPDHPTQPPLYQFIHLCIVLRYSGRLQTPWTIPHSFLIQPSALLYLLLRAYRWVDWWNHMRLRWKWAWKGKSMSCF